MGKFYLLLIGIIGLPFLADAQDTQWSVGLHGGPLINYTEGFDNQGGFLISPGAYFTKNERFEMAIMPYYGWFSFESFPRIYGSVNRLSVLEPHTYRYQSAGLNYQWRYTFSTRLLQPYAVALAGIGYTRFTDEQEAELGGGESVTSFASMNYGVGMGLQYMISEQFRLDFNFMATGTNAFEDPHPELFLQPMLGAIMNF